MTRRPTSWLTTLSCVAVFIVLETAAFRMVKNNGTLQRTWAAKGAHSVVGSIGGRTMKVREYFSLRARNEALAQDNFTLTQELLQAREQLREVRVSSAAAPASAGFSCLSAEVVKASRGSQHNYLILNKGYEDGVQEKSGVITSDGVVGIIDAVGAHYSYAFSFCNSDISISARLGREGAGGLLVWDGVSPDGAILKEIPIQNKYAPGDTVYTSGNSLLFPPDIPLGVAGEARIVNGATNEIAVRLLRPVSAIRYVTVIHNNAFDEIAELEP